jgi:putative transposase
MTRNGQMQIFSRQIGTLLSSYAQAYNKQQGRRGSLFQPKTKSTRLTSDAPECMKVIHARPVNIGLTFRPSDWEFSSLRDYLDMRRPTCNVALARALNLM